MSAEASLRKRSEKWGTGHSYAMPNHLLCFWCAAANVNLAGN